MTLELLGRTRKPEVSQGQREVLSAMYAAASAATCEVELDAGPSADGGIEIYHIAVADTGKGVGGAVLGAGCRKADEHGVVMIIEPGNVRAAALYARLGFAFSGDGPLMVRPANGHKCTCREVSC